MPEKDGSRGLALSNNGIRRTRKDNHRFQGLSLLVLLALTYYTFQGFGSVFTHNEEELSAQAVASLARCRSVVAKPGPPPDFHKRTQSDRFAAGTKPVLLKNAKIWTGNKNGTEVIDADILLDKGLIKGIGHVRSQTLAAYQDIEVVDVKGAWVTPGIVDLHSHLGDASSPATSGASGDDNSIKGPIQPWLRSLDGLNTHDDAYQLSISGGVTTALVLPGSANAIGGQAFTIKLRSTAERSPTAMLLEPPFTINNSFPEVAGSTPWRQMKHACGENPSRVYDQTRMDTIWQFREAYNKARELRVKQDQFCAKALNGDRELLESTPFPEDLQWEALADVVRGRVKVQVHCYETVDLDDIVRLTNEFQFPIAAFHHAHEAYLVPDVLKSAYGHPPAVAMFATNARYKREAYRGSEFAPRILAQNGLKVVMKSDHPVLDSRYLVYEAQQAYLYGLPENLAIAAVTSTPASIMGMDHRVGYVKEGWDADLVIWDSHPLALGATPKQVYIDGIPQLKDPHTVEKPRVFQETPRVPNFDQEATDAVKYEGLPPLEPKKAKSSVVVFTNVGSVYTRSNGVIETSFRSVDSDLGIVVVENGKVSCSGSTGSCPSISSLGHAEVIDLKGGSISPGLTTFGAPIGLEEIAQEDSTNDGVVFDAFEDKIPSIVGGDKALIRAVDGLQFGGRDTLLAYRGGVTSAIVAPVHYGFTAGLATSFSTGALSRFSEGSVLQEVTAVHVSVRHQGATPSVSSQIGALRRLLLEPEHHASESEAGKWFGDVGKGKVTLVVDTDSADIIATLVLLKKEVEAKFHSRVKLTIAGGLEAYLLAKELAAADVGVVQISSRPFPTTWEKRRILPGLPLSKKSSVLELLAHNVTVGIGIAESWSARSTRFDIGWIALDAGGDLTMSDALALSSTNLEKLLGREVKDYGMDDLVVTEGGDLLDFGSKVVAIVSPRRELVDLL
ncbi:carbohydrate esterase family 9 protein [Cristinia sonorae]|uniref:Carbohydrate esterase family 9 protein n=1 Tax=Cristinia sonorae TaxID=1940300 RepID=A0A8K0XRB8_9AGAR|nr:carbohydrate esterase family 9 protein [Cristinia sonorae]